MPKKRSPERDKAFELYKEHKGEIQLREISKLLNTPEKTISGWKVKDRWDEVLNGVLQKKIRSTPKDKTHATDKQQLRIRSGNHNPKNQFTERNKAAEKHGLFSKYLPEETLAIMQEIENKDPLDILWDNIMIQYTAIIRSQRIMYVTSKEEMIKELKKRKEIDFGYGPSLEEEWNFQFAWDRQASFLTAQSRAMAELRNMIRQYDEFVKSGMGTEEQRLRIEKLKVEIGVMKGEGKTNAQEGIDNFIKATTMTPDEIKAMFEGDNDEDVPEEE